MPDKIEAVIFDWGGVLIDDPADGLIHHCADHLGVSDAQFGPVFYAHSLDFQRGTIRERELWRSVCAELDIEQPTVDSLWRDAFVSVYSEKKEMFNLARKLQGDGYKTGFLSNTERPAMRYFHEQAYDMFDALVFSCAEGTAKPEKQIYLIALERLSVSVDRAVFIDDRLDYISGAKRVGLHTILFENPSQVKEDLRALLVRID